MTAEIPHFGNFVFSYSYLHPDCQYKAEKMPVVHSLRITNSITKNKLIKLNNHDKRKI